MIKLLLIVHAFIALGLIGVILIQRSDGGALGGLGGGSFGGMLTGRSSANLLTRVTAVLATIFMLNSLLLAILSGYGSENSIVDEINDTENSVIINEDDNKEVIPNVPSSN